MIWENEVERLRRVTALTLRWILSAWFFGRRGCWKIRHGGESRLDGESQFRGRLRRTTAEEQSQDKEESRFEGESLHEMKSKKRLNTKGTKCHKGNSLKTFVCFRDPLW